MVTRIPRFGEKKPDHSVLAPSRFLAKSPQILGNFQAHPGLRACLRKGKWRSIGDRKGETLWPLVFKGPAFRAAELLHDDAGPVLGGMLPASGAENIAD